MSLGNGSTTVPAPGGDRPHDATETDVPDPRPDRDRG